MLAGYAAIQRDLSRLEKQANGNSTGTKLCKFNKGKYKVLYLVRKNPRYMTYMIVAEGWKAAFQKGTLGTPWDTMLNMSQQCASAANLPNCARLL